MGEKEGNTREREIVYQVTGIKNSLGKIVKMFHDGNILEEPAYEAGRKTRKPSNQPQK